MTLLKSIALSAVIALLPLTVLGQPSSPYAGWENRVINSLSADEIRGLRSGRGMQQSLPAELSGYPGPRHVLELAMELGLSNSEQAQAQALFEQMVTRAIDLGEAIISAESRLDQMFDQAVPSASQIENLTIQIAQLRGQLRNVHLQAHLQMSALMSDQQKAMYQRLRGYSGRGKHQHGHH